MKPALADAIKTALGRLQNRIDGTPPFVADDTVEFGRTTYSNALAFYAMQQFRISEELQ